MLRSPLAARWNTRVRQYTEIMSFFAELANFLTAALQSLPFMALAVLGYLAVRNSALKPVAIAWLMLLMLGFSLFSFGMTMTGVMDLSGIQAGDAGASRSGVFLPDARGVVATGLFGVAFGLSLGCLGFAPAVRRMLARFTPIDPTSFVQMLALVSVVSLTILCVTPLIATGQPPLLKLLAQMSGAQTPALGQSGDSMTRTEAYTLIWQVPCAILAVGLGLKRNFTESLKRLGFVKPTLRQVALGVATAVVMVVLVTVFGKGISALWGYLGWSTTDETQVNKLMSFAFNPVSALVVAVVAGLGEELTVRGVLQPRLGLLLPNLFFASLHAFQYNFDALLLVFVVGLALAVLRSRTNTTTSAIAHGSYDFILLMLTTLQVPWFK